MKKQADEFQAWLDKRTPGDAEERSAADRAWSSRRPLPVRALVLATAASIAAALWWSRSPPTPPSTPEYSSQLIVSAADEEVRIEVGIRRTKGH